MGKAGGGSGAGKQGRERIRLIADLISIKSNRNVMDYRIFKASHVLPANTGDMDSIMGQEDSME